MSLLCKRTAEEAKLDEPPKKRHKKNKNYYEIFGDDAVVEIEIVRDELNKRRQRFLHSSDFHTLILWMLGETVSPNWVFIKHRPLIEKVIIVQIDHLNEAKIKSLKQCHSSSLSLTSNTANTNNVNVRDNNIESFPFFNKNNYCPLQIDIPKFDKSTKHPSFKKLTVVAVDKIKGLSSNHNNAPFGKKKKKRNNYNHHKQQNEINTFISSQFGNKYKYSPEIFISSQQELQRNGFPTFNDPQNRFQHFFQLPSNTMNATNSTQIRTENEEEEEDEEEEEEEDEDDDISSSDSSSSSSDSTVITGNGSNNGSNRNLKSIEKLVGLDCEMVVTTKGIELARISIVSESGQCIYDELVKPAHKITDYCTKYSGITSSMLENVTKTLNGIQLEMSEFMDESTIICGHGLENDLLALEMIHSQCIDTTLLYPSSSRQYKNKLRYLASKFLKRSIQQSHNGHNSNEDALAALDLVKLKFEHGPQYGLPSTNNYMSIFTVLHHFDRKSSLIGPSELFAPISSSTPVSSLPTICDTETIKKSISIICNTENDQRLIWMYLRGDGLIESLYGDLMNIYSSSPSNSVLITISGNKDFSKLNQLHDKAKAIRDGQIKEAEAIAAQIRNENFNAKQYPFWIYTKNC